MTPAEEAAYYVDLARKHAMRPEYRWCADKMDDIADTIERTGRLSPRQKQAIEHFILGRLKHDI